MLTVRRNRLRTCTSAFLIVAVDAINFGPDLLPVDLPSAELVDGRFVQPDQRAQRAADEVQFVLDDQVGWTKRRMLQQFWPRAGPSFDFGWNVESSISGDLNPCRSQIAVHLPEEHLHFALPRHLGELVHRGDQQRRQPAINLLVHHDHRQAFFRCLAFAEEALAELVAAVGQRAA